LDKAKEKTKLHSGVTPNVYHYAGTGAGKAGIGYNYLITNKYAGCEIYIDKGREFEEPNLNKIRFDELYKNKAAIEKEFGGELAWERLDNKRASRIAVRFDGVGLKDREQWDGIQDKMIDAMIRLERAFRDNIRELD
jgi:hypothetical protein